MSARVIQGILGLAALALLGLAIRSAWDVAAALLT